MSAETPIFARYQSLMSRAEQHAYLTSAGELLNTDATIELVAEALSAYQIGLTHEQIASAIAEGETRGVTKYHNLTQVDDPQYWQEVRQEAEAHWARRYDQQAREDW